jgi:hypothetical protein
MVIDQKIQIYAAAVIFFFLVLTVATFAEDSTPDIELTNYTLEKSTLHSTRISTSISALTVNINLTCLDCGSSVILELFIMTDEQFSEYKSTGVPSNDVPVIVTLTPPAIIYTGTWTLKGNAWHIIVKNTDASRYAVIALKVTSSALSEDDIIIGKLQLLVIRSIITLPIIAIGAVSLVSFISYVKRSERLAKRQARKQALEEQFQTKVD